MRAFLSFLIVFIKIFIFVKVVIVLYQTSQFPDEHPVNDLIWWSGFLVFDMWLIKQLPDTKEEEKEES